MLRVFFSAAEGQASAHLFLPAEASMSVWQLWSMEINRFQPTPPHTHKQHCFGVASVDSCNCQKIFMCAYTSLCFTHLTKYAVMNRKAADQPEQGRHQIHQDMWYP